MQKKIILVTGASSGLGLAMANALAIQGHTVYGASRSIGSNIELPFHPLPMDVTDDASVQAGIDSIIHTEGKIDVLINNAGVSITGALSTSTASDIQKQFDVNFFGLVRASSAVLPHMIAKNCGMVINIGSLAGLFGLPYQGLYCASKFALEGYSESLRMELQNSGVRVVVINPGDFKTPITSNRQQLPLRLPNERMKNEYQSVISFIEKDENMGARPEKLAALVCKIVNKQKPAHRYLVGAIGQTIVPALKAILPGNIFVKLMNRHYGIK